MLWKIMSPSPEPVSSSSKNNELKNNHIKSHRNHTNVIFLQKHRQMDQSLHPAGCIYWIILRLWRFLCVRDAGHRGNKITDKVLTFCVRQCVCVHWDGEEVQKMNECTITQITSTSVFIKDHIQGSEKHVYHFHNFSRTRWKILEHSTHHFDNGLIIWGWSIRNVGLTKVSSRNSPTSWANINTSQANKIYEDCIWSSLVLNTHYVMFPRHETTLIHYTGRAVINLGLDFTSRDSVDSYGPKDYATCPVRLFFQWHDVLAFS